MITAARLLCALGCLLALNCAAAPAVLDGTSDRIGAHFEASSSRLVAEETTLLTQFAARAEAIPGAKLAVLVPATKDPTRARFVAARVAELKRRVRLLADNAEFDQVQGHVDADVLWIVMIPPAPPESVEKIAPMALQPAPAVGTDALSQPLVSHANPADLQLTDWVIRGVKHPPQGPTYAYVARTGSGEAPREIFEQQTDKELGLVKDISQSPQGAWIVHTEIGWIGQAPSAGSLDAGGK